jgi:hypothetical protein
MERPWMKRINADQFILVAAAIMIPLVVLGIWMLMNAPYRPPYDNSTLLGESERQFCGVLIALLTVVWTVIAVCLGRTLVRSRRLSDRSTQSV